MPTERQRTEAPDLRDAGLASIVPGLLAALLFGAAAPLCKILLGDTAPLALAALLYLGSGVGLTVYILVRRLTLGRRSDWIRLTGKDGLALGGAVLSGGVLAPMLFMIGLSSARASTASFLLNLELVFTACLAWAFFHEGFEGRVAAGLAGVLGGCVVLGWPTGGLENLDLGALAVSGACLCWGLDNNLTQRLAGQDALQIAAVKGGIGGGVNALLALAFSQTFPDGLPLLGALGIGLLCYGLSLVLFVVSLGRIGTARTGGVFAAAPFVGVGISVVALHEGVTTAFLFAAPLVIAGL
ncbi:MAG: DMT family transporter, partial [Bacillota bacterium]